MLIWKLTRHTFLGNYYTDEPQVILYEIEAFNRFVDQLNNKVIVFDLGVKNDGAYYMDAMSSDPFFMICFTFNNAKIEWNEYKREAWYVKNNN